jgi:predicted dehydrogenase
MDFLIIGYGSIGRRHAKNLSNQGHKVSICTRSQSNIAAAEADGYTAGADLDGFLEHRFDGVFVCTPPSTHIDYARRSLIAGSNVFIEKPISDSLDDIDSIKDLAIKKGLIVQVGYNLRFCPGLKKLKEIIESKKYGKPLHLRATIGQYLPFWRPNLDYKDCYTGKKELGGSLLMELSHEVDYVIWLLGRPKSIYCKTSKISDLEINSEDTADLIITFHSGVVANIHLDFLRKDYARNCELLCQQGTLVWRFDPSSKTNGLELRKSDPQDPKIIISESLLDADFNTNDMYLDEVQAFVDSIEKKTTSGSDIDSAISTLKTTLCAYKSSQTGSTIDIY